MMTAMERSISPYEERGSEASTADSLKMQLRKAAKVRISNKGQLGMLGSRNWWCMRHLASILELQWK